MSPFLPPGILRNAQFQTILASSRFRSRGRNQMVAAGRTTELEVPGGIRLLGSRSTHRRNSAKGLVIMLHGWNGSIDSTYMLCTGRFLFDRGYDIFRLNFRDHGNSQHLNRGMFYAVLLDEIQQAVLQIADQAQPLPVYLVGFSLGGNFVLRILRACGAAAAPLIRHAVSVSPVLNPRSSTLCVDDHPLIRRYFLRKWKRSLQVKAALYPDLYDFSDILGLNTIYAITTVLLEHYSDYETVDSYFTDYSVQGDDLLANPLPATIIVAEDDPIIPLPDFYRLNTHPNTRLVVHKHGGHNGFLFGWPLRSWYDLEMLRIFGDCS